MDATDRIGKYLTYADVVRSATAKKYGIDNTPNEQQLENIKQLVVKFYDKLADAIGFCPPINSFFRSKELNEKVGGTPTSQHCANKGAAIDIDFDNTRLTNQHIFDRIRMCFEYDQLIWEKGGAWIHVSYNSGKNRHQVKAIGGNGLPPATPKEPTNKQPSYDTDANEKTV